MIAAVQSGALTARLLTPVAGRLVPVSSLPRPAGSGFYYARPASSYPARRPGHRRLSLGQASRGQVALSVGSSAATAAVPKIALLLSKAAWAVPVVGAAVAGVTLAITALIARKGPKQKVATTQMVERLAPEFQKNLDAYFAGPRTVSSQYVAVQNFDALWAFLSGPEQCGAPEMGNPGKACIADRARGGKFDWFAIYRDPIEQDTAVVEDPVTGVFSELQAAAGGGGLLKWLVPAALVFAGLAI